MTATATEKIPMNDSVCSDYDLTSRDSRITNRAAVKKHALQCSKERRAGKFTRVGEAFYQELEADVEALVRELRNKFPCQTDVVQPDETLILVTGDLIDKVKTELHIMIARMIQNKVQRQPSCGCTMQNTR